MKQSSLTRASLSDVQRVGLHTAIIMDGNGRWATSRGLPRVAGHRAGADAVRRTVEAAPALGISVLTLYAFSQDNWQRPQAEVDALMRLFRNHLLSETAGCLENGIRIDVIGKRDRLESSLLAAIESAESQTASCKTLHLRIAVDYSAKYSIMRAAELASQSAPITPERFAACLAEVNNTDPAVPEVDLLIRTGGEQRLSDFLLWECAYAEFVFTPRMWPDFGGEDIQEAVEEFHSRQRRFGKVPEVATG